MAQKTQGLQITTILASQSPARLETLRSAGIEPQVKVSEVDEDAVQAAHTGESYPGIVMALATAKAQEVYRELKLADSTSPTIVIGADTMLEIEGELIGKPHRKEIARQRWQAMRNSEGQLHTGHCVIFNPALLQQLNPADAPDDATVSPHYLRTVGTNFVSISATETTLVHFGNPTDADLERYLNTPEPLHVAGSFTVDGLGGAFIDRVEGDYHSVVGISLPLLRRILNSEGANWTDLWTAN
ncbi:Maf family protein [Boudabousia marimammalium]|uniref:Nucleoside triphosphate pyrophosphatase n=1 Tax=Boudabousia marimammalium TaxID=156892 RepID=A0A1Q5PS52_9ACTO|nr:Maf family protein [Boudabousia marimammalium]OKL50240.1 hypothetical protein BM477_02285 [Boudabousia marimammalium]